MEPAQKRFKLYDVVTATDLSIQAAYNHGLRCPPTGELTVLGFNGERLVLSDGSCDWHHSHFFKVGSHPAQDELQDPSPHEAVQVSARGTFNEFGILEELAEYVEATYGEHYAKGGVQAFALIAKRPQRGLAFALGNAIKYADRFGAKEGMNRKDLLKVAHYALLAIHCHDRMEAAHEHA